MKTSAIINIKNDGVCLLKESYLNVCNGHKGAGLLLNLFIYWHDIKVNMVIKNQIINDVAERHGDERVNDETLFQWHTAEELYNSLMGLVGKQAISEGVKLLEKKGYISLHKNPNPRYKFDNTRFFLIHPEPINADLTDLGTSTDQISNTVEPNKYDEMPRSVETSTKTTSKTTSKTTKKEKIKETPLHIPDEINISALNEFKEFRVEIKKPLTNTALDKVIIKLTPLSYKQQQDVVDYSIVGRYQGIFTERVAQQPKRGVNETNYKLSPLERVQQANEQKYGKPEPEPIEGEFYY